MSLALCFFDGPPLLPILLALDNIDKGESLVFLASVEVVSLTDELKEHV